MMTVVVPPLTRSRVSAHVRSSRKTVSGGLPDGAVGGPDDRCADIVVSVSKRPVIVSSDDFFMAYSSASSRTSAPAAARNGPDYVDPLPAR
jgi:hypothetical protein